MTTPIAAMTGKCASLPELVEQVREAASTPGTARETAGRVAASFITRTPGLDVLGRWQRTSSADRLLSFVVHTESLFSVVAIVCRPGQQTSIHDHRAWGVVTVLCGHEHETVYRDDGDFLTPVAEAFHAPGSVTAFAPPGDIHRVRNDGRDVAISLHVYGADLALTGSSVRRTYDLPVLTTKEL